MKPHENSTLLDGAAGAYVVTVALASSREEYENAVTVYMGHDGLHVVEVEDVEPLAARRSRGRPDAAILAMASKLTDDAPVIAETFDTYTDDDSH